MDELKDFNHYVNTVITARGVEIMKDPVAFREALMKAGCGRNAALLAEYCLTTCPVIANAVMKKNGMSCEEMNLFVTELVRSTGLTPMSAREFLTELAGGAGKKLKAYALPSAVKKKMFFDKAFGEFPKTRNFSLSFGTKDEQERLDSLINSFEFQSGRKLSDIPLDEPYNAMAGGVDSTLSAIDKMARNGNAQASYYIGCLFLHSMSAYPENKEKARTYLGFAAEMGYGPAYAALAFIEFNDKHGSMEKASSLLSHPLAYEGRDGKKWIELARIAYMCRKNNLMNARTLLPVGIFSLILGLLLCRLVLLPGIAACVLSAAGIGTSIFALTKRPFFSQKKTLVLFASSWIAWVISLFFVR